MDCIYIAPLSKALYNLCLSFTHTFTHQRRLAAMQGTNQLNVGKTAMFSVFVVVALLCNFKVSSYVTLSVKTCSLVVTERVYHKTDKKCPGITFFLDNWAMCVSHHGEMIAKAEDGIRDLGILRIGSTSGLPGKINESGPFTPVYHGNHFRRVSSAPHTVFINVWNNQ